MKSWIIRVARVGNVIEMGGVPVSAGEKKGSQLTITSPRTGDIVGSTVELTYLLQKSTKGHHVHAFVDEA
ncbi:MAG TPA: hypothetical protein PKK23_16005 [Nitrospirales bacterium]|nr:hypothetical protein [Nitrospirales bacterium]